MITYFIWEAFIEDFDINTTNSEKIGIYAFLSFSSIFTIVLDVLFSVFELLGLLIFIITKYYNK